MLNIFSVFNPDSITILVYACRKHSTGSYYLLSFPYFYLTFRSDYSESGLLKAIASKVSRRNCLWGRELEGLLRVE